MTVLLILIPVALFLGLLGLAGFLWTLRSGQFDDLQGAAERILLEDDEILKQASPDEQKPALKKGSKATLSNS